MTDLRTTQAHCNSCARETKHAVLHSATRPHVEYDRGGDPIHEEIEIYYLIQCRGCDEIKLKVESKGPWPDMPPDYYPPSIFRRTPEWMNTLILNSFGGGVHETLFGLLTEVYKALRNGMPRLAAMGVRALLEAIMLDKVGDNGNFKANVAKFAANGHIATNQVARITSVLDAGSAVIHRGYAPSDTDVIAMVNLAENLVESIYFHDDQLNAVAGRVPSRVRP